MSTICFISGLDVIETGSNSLPEKPLLALMNALYDEATSLSEG